jgi:glucosamine--fructose-6-phosphate aminotransferase (isomerizing)
MCGIIGYIGKRPAQTVILEGLRRLEYRGYDSAGLCILIRIVLNSARRPAASMTWQPSWPNNPLRAIPASATPAGPRTGRPPTPTRIRTSISRAKSLSSTTA